MLLYGLEYTVLFLLRRGTDTISRFALPFYIERCDKFLIGLHIGIHPRNWKRYLVNIYKDFFSREQPLLKNFSRVSKTASPFQLNSHVSGACVRSTSTCSRIRYRFVFLEPIGICRSCRRRVMEFASVWTHRSKTPTRVYISKIYRIILGCHLRYVRRCGIPHSTPNFVTFSRKSENINSTWLPYICRGKRKNEGESALQFKTGLALACVIGLMIDGGKSVSKQPTCSKQTMKLFTDRIKRLNRLMASGAPRHNFAVIPPFSYTTCTVYFFKSTVFLYCPSHVSTSSDFTIDWMTIPQKFATCTCSLETWTHHVA